MFKIKFLPHTADAKFRVTGDSLEQAFIGAAKALTKVMTDDVVKPVFKKLISVKAKTLEALLYDFLQELVFLLDVEGFLMSRVESLTINKLAKAEGFVLKAVVLGDKVTNYEVKDVVKAITYNDMVVEERFVNGRKVFVVQVVVDL